MARRCAETAIHLVAIGTVFLAVAGCNRAERRAHDVFGGTEHQARQVDINTASRKDSRVSPA